MKTILLLALTMAAAGAAEIRVGIVGTDTSHVTAFTKQMNDPSAKGYRPGVKVVAAWKGGSKDVESSWNRVDGYAKELEEKYGVKLVGSIDELCRMVDAVLLESVDGRVHLAQARAVIAAKKPMFIDKPLAAKLEEAREIARLAAEAGVPWWSSSSLRYDGVADLRKPNLSGAETWGPGPGEEHHYLDLSWYAIHPIEMLYTLMGEGCEEVTRISTADSDVIVGKWKGGRIGSVRALRPYSHYGAVAFSKGAKDQVVETAGEPRDGYTPLVREIVKFFETRVPPVPNSETLEIYAFMDAAQRSKEQGGKPMKLR